jgi:rRNA maturation endonuclease Nob1
MGFKDDILNRIKNEVSWKAGQQISKGIDAAASKILQKKTPENKCPKCNKVITETGLKFCPDCGGKLMYTCSKCNVDYPTTKKFCTQCGEALK